MESPARLRLLCLVLSLLWLSMVLLNCAWQADDAYITHRTVENLLAGWGPVWNPGERVQSFTHPLWMVLLAGARLLTGEAYYGTLALSGALTVAAVAVLLRRAEAATVLAAVAALTASAAVVDYAASGLENPLAYLLVALLPLALRPPRPAAVALLTAALALTRPDAVLFAAPALLWVLWRTRAVGAVLLGLSPLLLWEGFSLLYYGSLVPNTAYAKLNLAIDDSALWAQGGRYLLDTLRHDPLTIALIVVGIGAGAWRGGAPGRLLSLGVALYVVYVAKIGGGFMAGRFLAAPAFASVVVAASVPHPRAAALAVLAVATLAGVVPADAPWRSGADHGQPLDPDKVLRGDGISDERRFYYPYTGLRAIQAMRPVIEANGWPVPPHPGSRAGVALRAAGQTFGSRPDIGMFGYFAGPQAHLLDPYALNDPLLARLPYVPEDGTWRIGHYPRRIPEGYAETLQTGENRLADPQLRAFYGDLSLVLSGPLLAPERLAVIWRLHTGAYAGALSRTDYR